MSKSITATELARIHAKYDSIQDGKIADYIPELAKANPRHFGIAVTTIAGDTFEAGDSRHEFTIQSISKPFVYGLALEDRGREDLHSKVGVEPTGEAFNSIIELEEKSHRPYNPMINSGAIAVSSMILGNDPSDRLNRIIGLFSRYAGHPVHVDVPVFVSERSTGHRNRAIAHLLRNFGVIGSEIDATLDLYFQQCSVLMSTKDLSVMAATLANGGVNPVTGERVLQAEFVKDLLSLMFTCGMYDSAGEWAYTVGLPAKSGVSGGILAVVPGKMGIASYSPLLDSCGHSVRGIRVFRELSALWNLSVFDPQPLRDLVTIEETVV
jgi:glutaminase